MCIQVGPLTLPANLSSPMRPLVSRPRINTERTRRKDLLPSLLPACFREKKRRAWLLCARFPRTAVRGKTQATRKKWGLHICLEVLRRVPLGLEEALVPYELLHPVSEEAHGDPRHALAPDAELVVGPVVHQEALEVPRREDLDDDAEPVSAEAALMQVRCA